jgi:hypothetical protein
MAAAPAPEEKVGLTVSPTIRDLALNLSYRDCETRFFDQPREEVPEGMGRSPVL